MKLSIKDIDIDNEDFQRGVRFCIEELRSLQERERHTLHWNFSLNRKMAPVELSDYLLTQVQTLRRKK